MFESIVQTTEQIHLFNLIGEFLNSSLDIMAKDNSGLVGKISNLPKDEYDMSLLSHHRFSDIVFLPRW